MARVTEEAGELSRRESPDGGSGPLGAFREAFANFRRQGPPSVRTGLILAGVVLLWLIGDNIHRVFDSVLPRGLPVGIVILGVVFGSLYGLLGVGVVLIYRANRAVNFAQAELGVVAAVVAIQLVLQQRWNYFLAIAAGFGLAFVMGGILEILVIRRFRRAPRLIVAVATIGIGLILNGASIVIGLIFEGGASAQRFQTPFEVRFTIFPVIFNGNHVLAMVAAPIVMVALIVFLRFTDYGVAIRASAENGDRANLLGVPVMRLSTIVWAIAGLLSALAVILRVPIVGFASFNAVSGAGNSLLLRTLAAAVLGRMESLPRTVVAGIALGVFQELASWTYSNTDFVDALLVLVILGALLAQRDFFKRALETGIGTFKTVREVRPIPTELKNVPEIKYGFGALRLVILVVAVGVPVIASPSQEQAAALVLIYAMVAISLLILTGWAGQISLGQWAFVGFGAAATSALHVRWEWDYFLAMVGGVAVSAFVALILGLPALRIKGPFLAVTTLAFAVTSAGFFLEDRYFPWAIVSQVERPDLWGRFSLAEEWQMYYFSLAALLFTILVARNLRRSRTGRALIAVRDNEAASETFTLNTTRIKLSAFVISGALAGLGGAVYVLHQRGVFTGSYHSGVSVELFTMVVIGGLGSLPGAILGAVFVRGAQSFLPAGWSLIASGAGVLILLIFLPEGLGGLLYQLRDGILRRVARQRNIIVPSLLADIREESEYKPPSNTFEVADVPMVGDHDGASAPDADGEAEERPALASGRRR